MSQPLVIYGAGGHGREIAALIRALGRAGADWSFRGWLTDDARTWGKEAAGWPVLGDGEWLRQRPGIAVAVAIGDPLARGRVVERIQDYNPAFPVLVDPSAQIMEGSAPGRGSIVMAGAVVSIDVAIGEFACLNMRVSVSHDCRLGKGATLGPAVTLAGSVTIGAWTTIGAAATCLPGISIGERSVVGAGAVVLAGLPAECTAVGVPARVIGANANLGSIQPRV